MRLIRDGREEGSGYGGGGSKQTWCLTSTESIRLIRDGEKGVRMGYGGGGGGREIIYLSLHCHHPNDSCIKMGSGESRFNVSLTVREKVTRQRPQTATFEEKGEPKRIRTGPSAHQPNAFPLGQTGSRTHG